MPKKIILGLLPDPNSIETLLNNLEEADFDTKDISLVMKEGAQVEKLTSSTGPLGGITLEHLDITLQALGVPQELVTIYAHGVEQQHVLMALFIPVESVTAAQSMLADYNTESIIVL